MKLKILTLLLFIGAILQSVAQNRKEVGSPFIQYYPPKIYSDVSVSPQNWTIVQDKRGIMYIGNTEGLLEYDGASWRMIRTSNNSIVRSMDIDTAGTIYIGASGELGYLGIINNGTLEYVSLKNKVPDENKNFNNVWNTKATSRGIYFYTQTNIFRYHNKKIEIVDAPQNCRARPALDEMFLIHPTDNGIYVIRNNKLQMLPHTQDVRPINITEYSDDEFLFMANNRFFIYDMGQLNLHSEIPISKQTTNETILMPLESDAIQFLTQNRLYTSTKIDENTFAFGTLRNGILIMDKKGKTIQTINKQSGLETNSVYNLFLDNNKYLWAGLDKGVASIEVNSPISQFGQSDGLPGSPYSVIRHKGKIYVGTVFGIVYTEDTDKRGLNFIPVANGQFTAWQMGEINNTLLAFGNNGVFHIKDSIAIQLPNTPAIFSYGLSKKFPNHIFLGLNSGFQAIEVKYPQNDEENITILSNHQYTEIHEPIRKIVSDNNGDLWMTPTFSGIYRLKFQGRDLFRYNLALYDTAQGLPQLDYNLVHWINDRLVVATRKGIYKLIREGSISKRNKFVLDNSFGSYFNEKKLPINQIFVDKDERTWIFSDYEGFGEIIQQEDGPYWNSIPFKKIPIAGAYGYYIEPNGLIWALCADALFRYDPGITKDYQAKFNTFVRKVVIPKDSTLFNGSLFDENSFVGNHYSKVGKKQPLSLIPTLDYKHNSITFEFAAAFYDNETENQYKYLLEGFDREWSNWNSKSIKEYTNLPEGEYTFHVKALNIFNTESPQSSYKFTISPPIYRTYYAYATYILIFGFLIFITIWLNSKRLKAANLRLENIINERTAEVQKRNEDILDINKELSKQKEEVEKQAKLLEESNVELEKLSLVASETDNAILIMDAKGNFEWVNESYTRMFGYSLEELVREVSPNIISHDTPEHIKELVNKAIENKETVMYEFATMSRSGKSMWVQCTLTPITDEYENVSKLIAVDTDITQIKNVEQEILKKNEEIIKQRDLFKTQKQRSDKAWNDMKRLSDFGQGITSVYDLNSINDMIYEYITSLMDTTTFGIGIYNEEKERIEFRNFIDKDEPIPFFSNEMSQDDSLTVWCVRNKKDLLIKNLEKEYSKYIEKPNFETFELPSSMIYALLMVENKPLGIITAQSYKKEAYNENDLTILNTLAAYISFAIDKGNLLQSLKSKDILLSRGIAYAESVHNSLLPDRKDMEKVFDTFILFRPKEQVSGDLYWFHRLSRDEMLEKVIVAVVDCTGHSIQGAFISTVANELLNYVVKVRRANSPRRILDLLDINFRKALRQDSGNDRDFLEVCICSIEQTLEGNVKVIFGGARRPLFYYSKASSQIQLLEGDRKHIGGIKQRSKRDFTEQELILNPGDIIYMMTDGLNSQISTDRKRFSTKRIISNLEKNGHLPLKDQRSGLENAFDFFRQNEEQKDDITVIGIRV